MKLSVSLAVHNYSRHVASIAAGDFDAVDVASRKGAKAACLAAAERLDDLARKFRALAAEPEPAKVDAQDRVNAMTKAGTTP